MPPIEAFAGLDAVRRSAEEVTGLPSRKELEQWLQEHDKIERDTEIFDSGEMAKLRRFTKGAYYVALHAYKVLKRLLWWSRSCDSA